MHIDFIRTCLCIRNLKLYIHVCDKYIYNISYHLVFSMLDGRVCLIKMSTGEIIDRFHEHKVCINTVKCVILMVFTLLYGITKRFSTRGHYTLK
jgi:hypothetical protein